MKDRMNQNNTSPRTTTAARARYLVATAAILVLACMPLGAQANTCPLLAGGKPFGPTTWAPDGSDDEKTYYRYITDNDYMMLDSIFYCLD